MDFTALMQKIMGGLGGQAPAGAPIDIRPPMAGGSVAPTPATAPAGPSIFQRLGAGMQGAAGGMGEDLSPMAAMAKSMTAARGAQGGPSIMPKAPMAPVQPGAPMNIMPPAAGGPPLPAAGGGGDMGGLVDKLALLLGSI